MLLLMAEWKVVFMLFESNVLLGEIKLDTTARPECLTAVWNYHDKVVAAKMLELVMRIEKHVISFGYASIHEGVSLDKTFEDACKRCTSEVLKLALQLSEDHQNDLSSNSIIFFPPKDLTIKLTPYFALNDHTISRMYHFLNLVLGSYSKERIVRETSPFSKTPIKYVEFEPDIENKQMIKNLNEINNTVQFKEINSLIRSIQYHNRMIYHQQRLSVFDDYHMRKDDAAADAILYCEKVALATLETLNDTFKEKLEKQGFNIKELIKPHILYQRKTLTKILPEEEATYQNIVWDQQEEIKKINKFLYKTICTEFVSLAHKGKIILEEDQSLEDLTAMLKIKAK